MKLIKWVCNEKRTIPKYGVMCKNEEKRLPVAIADSLIKQKLAVEVKETPTAKQKEGKK